MTLFVFLGSRKFHSFGLFEYTITGTGADQRQHCSKGWEWWLSIIWQFWWSWIYAPYCLWKSRAIKDVHHWRLQTICCCIAGFVFAHGPAPDSADIEIKTSCIAALVSGSLLPWFRICQRSLSATRLVCYLHFHDGDFRHVRFFLRLKNKIIR